ncbi:dinitrogenase iron-molybdenum cofactor biosynthesis protein [Halarcobacter ebronensis]|uniref:Dinitrogenase iron-molybdenum cofactor biosynthesis protein n=1 Tax=Halarcobacter ebronensis TaxID=1462615 RepID=A0A4Q0YDL2_9BACT|nr:NifB/NifX family molybdenum-iron cluster-binding protein [Halarcobacter ebronensis]RXJ68560.1 dinitrogenase iron-molybdenum cofactor biosynthesis protein [Halarcobacter ebronensis]
MLAIPLDKNDSTTISDLFGNAPYFALLDTKTNKYKVEKNSGCGNGLESAAFVKNSGANATIFFHMGDGVFKNFYENNIKVYCVEKKYLTIEEISKKVAEKSLAVVTKENAKTLLDSGTATCRCECND